MRAARYGLGAVVFAAGASGAALLAFPASTGDFFSWELEPPPLASLIGGLYVASSVVFGIALTLPWRRARSLVAASIVLTAPTFVATMVHLEVFDLDRWQAWFWVLLFAGAPWFWAGALLANAAEEESSVDRPLGAWRAFPAIFAVAAAGAAVIVWVDPIAAAGPLPFDFSPMGGRFAGSWLAFLALLAAWAWLRPKEARFPLLALAVYPIGAMIAALRSFGALESPGRYWYVVVLAAVSMSFGALSLACAPRSA